MAGQPVRRLLVGVVAAAALASCRNQEPFEGRFDMPTALAVLQTEPATPFEEPIGYAASGHTGLISLLALKQGRFLADDDQASFLRAAPIATGRLRLIDGLAVWSPAPDNIWVFGIDKTFGQLFKVPHVVGVDDRGVPIEGATTFTEPEFVDADGSGDSPTLTDLQVKPGFTAAEEWVAEYDGEVWRVIGSRSGEQPLPAYTGAPYVGQDRAVQFTINGAATAGDQFVFSTDNGLVEFDTAGLPLHLSMSPDQSRLAVVVRDEVLGSTVLRWFEPVTGAYLGDSALPADSVPGRMAWAEDGVTLFVADEARPAAWEIRTDAGDAVIEHPLPWPVFDVAALFDTATGQRRLFVAPVSGREVWIVDADTDTLIDVNPTAPDVQGMGFTSPVRGLEAIPIEYDYLQVDNDGVRLRGRSIAVSLYAGEVVFIDEQTGCLVQDGIGPRTDVQSGYGSTYDHDTSFESVADAAYLEQNATNLHHVQVNACSGLAPSEVWTLRYSRALQAWEVEGVYSGVQEGLAYEDQRYTSDNGEISFTVRAGVTPSEDGWQISFSVLDGALSGDGNNDATDDREIRFDMPGDPVFFQYRVGPTGGGWDPVDLRAFVMVASQDNDVVARIEPPTGDIEVQWE